MPNPVSDFNTKSGLTGWPPPKIGRITWIPPVGLAIAEPSQPKSSGRFYSFPSIFLFLSPGPLGDLRRAVALQRTLLRPAIRLQDSFMQQRTGVKQ